MRLDATVGIELWQVLTLVFVGALFDAPGSTARTALFPDAVRMAGVGMKRATGLRGAIQQSSVLVGGPLGGLLVATLGATNALWLDVATFLVSACLVAVFVPRSHPTPESESKEESGGSSFGELAAGLRFIWSQRVIRAVVLTVLVTNLLDSPFPVLMSAAARPRGQLWRNAGIGIRIA